MEQASRHGLTVLDAITRRRSVRQFVPLPVPRPMINAILKAASRAPSGMNIQPWRIHVVSGAARDRLSKATRAAAEAGRRSDEYAYMPSPLKEPYLSRRRKLGYALYALYGIDAHDRQLRREVMLRNYDFFGAPVGLFFTMERCLALGSWLDCGMFMQNVMIVARSFGLETCPQQAWCEYGAIVHDNLGIGDDFILVSGMALGFADEAAPQNRLVTEREPLEGYVAFHGQ